MMCWVSQKNLNFAPSDWMLYEFYRSFTKKTHRLGNWKYFPPHLRHVVESMILRFFGWGKWENHVAFMGKVQGGPPGDINGVITPINGLRIAIIRCFFSNLFFLQCSDRRLHAKPEASNPSASVSCRALGLGFKVQQWDWVTMTWRKMGIPWNYSHPKPSFVKDRWPALLVPTVSHANGLHHKKASNYGHEGTSCHNEMCVQHYLLQKQRQGMRGKLHKKNQMLEVECNKFSRWRQWQYSDPAPFSGSLQCTKQWHSPAEDSQKIVFLGE